MKKITSIIFLFIILFSFAFKVSASELCSPNGYTILTINGIFTDENGARQNKVELAKGLPPSFNNQPLKVNYIYNPTHLAGVGDLIDVVKQGFFGQKSDYDLVEMLNDASQKVTTQKLLLVAHSQGNFYANNFYDKVASQEGGVPSQSIGVYGVASPANRVPGGGKYLTSDTDGIIASLFGNTLGRNIMSPNTHIIFQNSDDKDGHDFSKVYLKYQGDRIVSDIKSSLDSLKENDEQEIQEPCISPPELSTIHKIQGAILAVADPTANVVRGGLVITYNTGIVITNTVKSTISSLAGSLKKIAGNLANNNGATVILSNGGVPKNTNVADSAKDSPSPKSSVALVIDKIKTLAMGIIDPNFALAENNGDSSLPVGGDVSNSGDNGNNNSSSGDSGGGGGNSGGGVESGSGGGGGESTTSPIVPVQDTIPPVITILGDNPVEITKDAIYTDAGATALDDVDGVLEVITTGVIDMTIVGSYIVTYTATDLSENTATATRTVNVVAPPLPPPIPDITPPVISIIGDNPVEITKDTAYIDAGVTALDDVDGDITANVVTVNPVDVNTISDYTITYNVRDAAENPATQVTRLVHVVPSNVLYSQPDYSTEISSGGSISSFDSFTGASGHVQSIKFAYNDYGNSTGHFIGVSVVDRTEGINYYGTTDGGGCGDTYESTGLNTKTIIELDSSVKYKAYPCTGSELTLDPTHTYGISLFRNQGGSDTQRFYGSINSNDSVYLYVTDDTFPSIGKSIRAFSFPELGSTSVIDEVNHNINVTVPFGTDITALTPRIKISGGASISPNNNVIQNFTNPITYVVTAENGLSQSYIVTALIHSKVIYSQSDNSVEITAAGNVNLQNIFTSATGNISNLKFSYNDHGNSTGHFIGVQIVDQNTGLSYYASKPGFGGCGDAFESLGIGVPTIVTLDETFQYKQYPCTGPNLVLSPTHVYSVSLFRNQGGSDTQRFYGSSNTNNAAYLQIETNGVATLSSAKQITAFNFNSLSPSVTGVVDEVNHTVSLIVPFGTNVTALAPTIAISSGASINPNTNTAQDFTSPVTYPITAEDGSTQNYIATATIAPDPNPGPDITPPSIMSYTFNGVAGDITADPLTNPISFILTASEKVNWTSIKIENQNNPDIHKYFYDGANCVNGTNTCSKIWDGETFGGTLQNGIYKIKVHMIDLAGNDYLDYLSPYVITVNLPPALE